MRTTDISPQIGARVLDSMRDLTRAQGAGVRRPAPGSSYLQRELDRERRLRNVIGDCERCHGPIHESPGYCTSCAWDDLDDATGQGRR